MPSPRVWLLNLDADIELGTTGPYTTRRAIAEQIARQLLGSGRAATEDGLVSVVHGGLLQTPSPSGVNSSGAPLSTLSSPTLGPAVRGSSVTLADLLQGEPVLDLERPVLSEHLFASRGQVFAVPWCPTPSALRRLQTARLRTPRAPDVSVLRAANHRRLLLELPSPLERRWIERREQLAFVAQPTGFGFRLKRPFGFAGKGQRVLRARTSADDLRWLDDSLGSGFLCEPNADIVEEWSQHGYIDDQGVLLGSPCRQRCDRFGRVVELERLEPVTASSDVEESVARRSHYLQELCEAAHRVAERLSALGYFGPFSFDAFLYRTANGIEFNPVSDVNARFSLGWSVGMGEGREAALERLERSR